MMKHTKIEFIVYDNNGVSRMVTTNKEIALNVMKHINGTMAKRITTVEEVRAIDKECTVWA